tara:strand:- start:546 stop:716 length:171 start_codon:yes stop_codon:yes gene_type:complete
VFAIFGPAFFYYPTDCDRLLKSGDIASISLFLVQVDSVIFGWFLLIDSFLLELPEM